jgi:hypothetical protein
MRRVAWALAVLVAALSPTATSMAQGLPAGGYHADGAYYVPDELPGAAPATTDRPAACPPGYGVPTVYVASTATMVRIYQYWPAGGGDAPGFPYVPVYPPTIEC